MVAHAGPQRLRQLVEAIVAVGSELDLRAVLERIVTVATELVDAKYGALGVLDESGTELAEFITVGIDEEQRRAIGHPPKGHGILGHVIRKAEPLRLPDIREHAGSSGIPANHPPMRSFLGVPIRVHGEVFGNLYLTEKQGAEVFTDVDEELLVGLATAAGVAVRNARLYEQARRRERAIDAFGEVATSLLAGAGSDEALQLIARRARELVGADASTIALPEPGGDLRIAVADGDVAADIVGERFPREGSVSGSVLETGEPAFLEDASADARQKQPLVAAGVIGPAVYVPLVDGVAYGTLAVGRLKGGRPFTVADRDLLVGFARQASVVLAHEAKRAQLAELARLDDQERIARDLHDSVIQRIFAASLSLQGAAGLTKDDEVRQRIERGIDELDTAMRLIRAVIFDIGRRTPLGEAGVRRRVMDLAAESSRILGYSPQVTFSGPVDNLVGEEVAKELLPTIREALSNVARHAAARKVTVSLSAGDGRVVLEVVDDGVGLRPGAGGSGIANMRTRAERLGGRCTVEPGERGGTRVHWEAPLPAGD